MAKFLNDYESKLGIKITCSQKTEPLSTACPLALAKDKLIDESIWEVWKPLPLSVPKPLVDFANKPAILYQIEALKATGVAEVFVVINKEQEERQKASSSYSAARGTTGKVESYVEMPKTVNGNYIDAGIYLLNSSVLDRIKLRLKLFGESIFQDSSKARTLCNYVNWVLDAYWTAERLPYWRRFIFGYIEK
ncbi:hypothetical protein Scep_021418 [Stephania cephalantha]|uniref:Nucleotidyl transferase domain-containing protein n=1 Tax=Stephania cephalantha TaxID=152367 RepID=A0AAP0FDM0_9MAGN